MKAVVKRMAIDIQHTHVIRLVGRSCASCRDCKQAVRVDLMLEAELIGVDALVAVAVLDGEDVRICDMNVARPRARR